MAAVYFRAGSLIGMAYGVALIGGTGVGTLLAELAPKAVHVPTEFGLFRARRTKDGVLVVQRHSAGHKTPPHLVNYRAIATGLKALGVRYCLATAAVGSLSPELGIGALAPCTDFIDVSGRNITLFDREVAHTPMNFGASAAYRALREAANATPRKVVYGCANGPRYETVAEIRAYQALGIDVVGMTAASEAIVMQEAGIEYGCLAIVTNLAQGLGEADPEHAEVAAAMEDKGEEIVSILLAAASRLGK